MNIYDIEITNNKHIRCFKKTLNGDNMIVAGDTGTGKTTAISGLFDILKKCPDALTHGAKKGEIKIKLSDGSKTIIAKRTTTAKSSTISIINTEDGEEISIKDFDKMISDLSVNPHQISLMKPTEQLKTLAVAAGIEDLDRMDFAIKQGEDDRLDCFRQMEASAPGAEPEKVEPVDVSALLSEKTVADNHNYDLRSKTENLQRMVEEGLAANTEIERLGNELKAKIKAQDERRAEAEELKARVEKLTPIDTTDLVTRIDSAQTTNDAAAAHRNWTEASKRHEAKTTAHTEADAKVKDLRAKKKTALDGADWPIEGLSIDDGKILYNDCLLSNLGTSEQLLVCAAIAVKDIAAHPVKVVKMDGVEAMSPGDLAALQKIFNGKGVQVLSTRVTWGDTQPDEIVIEEGVYSDGEA